MSGFTLLQCLGLPFRDLHLVFLIFFNCRKINILNSYLMDLFSHPRMVIEYNSILVLLFLNWFQGDFPRVCYYWIKSYFHSEWKQFLIVDLINVVSFRSPARHLSFKIISILKVSDFSNITEEMNTLLDFKLIWSSLAIMKQWLTPACAA